MKQCIRVLTDEDGRGPGDYLVSRVAFDPDDPGSVEKARSQLSGILRGRPVPQLCGGSERSPRRFLRSLIRGSW